MSNEMDFYNIHDQTDYKITISKPESVEDLSDLFVTKDELEDIVGRGFYVYSTGPVTFTLKKTVEREVRKWADKLDGSKKKSILIEDQELLDVLKGGHVTDYTPDTTEYGRHGDRLCYARRYKREKTRATQGDVSSLWSTFSRAFKEKFGCYPSHIPRYDRHPTHFKAWKKILGWKVVRQCIYDKESAKFYRQIWDNPEEYIK